MAFASTGPEVNISAPGYGINVAYPGDKAAQVSGSSSSAPILTGFIAGVSTNGGGTLVQSANRVMSSLNDIGTLGPG